MGTPDPPSDGLGDQDSEYPGRSSDRRVELAVAVRDTLAEVDQQGLSLATVRRALHRLDEVELGLGGQDELRAGLASERADLWGRLADIQPAPAQARDAAVGERRRALTFTAAGSPQELLRRANLAAELVARFSEQSRPDDLDTAIPCSTTSWPAPHPPNLAVPCARGTWPLPSWSGSGPEVCSQTWSGRSPRGGTSPVTYRTRSTARTCGSPTRPG